MAEMTEEIARFIADGKRVSSQQDSTLTDPSTQPTQIIAFEGVMRITDNSSAVLDQPTGSGFIINITKINNVLGGGTGQYTVRRSSSNIFEIQQDFEQGTWDANITLTNGDIRIA